MNPKENDNEIIELTDEELDEIFVDDDFDNAEDGGGHHQFGDLTLLRGQQGDARLARVSLEKIDFALNILLVCFLAMKASGHTWHQVSLDEQEQHMARLAGSIKFGADLSEHLQSLASQQYIEAHDERYLLAYVINECNTWLKSVQAVESDKYVLLALINLVNCIAIRPAQNTQKKRMSR